MHNTLDYFLGRELGLCPQSSEQVNRATKMLAGPFLRNCLIPLVHAKHQKHPCGSIGAMVCFLRNDAVTFASSTAREPGA